MRDKYFRTKCYWFNEYQDMNAIVPTCNYYGQYGSCSCSDECEHYISEQEVEKIIRKRADTEWIPCSERLPEEGVNVLLCIKDWESQKTKIVVSLRRDYNYWDGLGRDIRGDIAWMPLPAPYKGGDDE